MSLPLYNIYSLSKRYWNPLSWQNPISYYKEDTHSSSWVTSEYNPNETRDHSYQTLGEATLLHIDIELLWDYIIM